jgi:hypothetical protein
MDRATLGKVGQLLVLLVGVALLVATATDAGTVGGFGGFVIGGSGGGIIIGGFFGGFGGEGGSTVTQVPQASSLMLTVLGLGVAAWGVWRNRH